MTTALWIIAISLVLLVINIRHIATRDYGSNAGKLEEIRKELEQLNKNIRGY